MRNDDDSLLDRDADEVPLLAALPRETPVTAGEFDRLLHRLRIEGFFPGRARRSIWGLAAGVAAALLLFAAGVGVGAAGARRNSLEDMLSHSNLSVGDRVLLLQRAGSAYVRAAQGYANATANADSSAVEVASNVLMEAAHAVARNGLDGGLSARLAAAFRPSALVPVAAPHRPVIWY